MILRCMNGEYINTRTGAVLGYEDFIDIPPLSRGAENVLRTFDGLSCESLGTVPKVASLGKEELVLLRKLRPWPMLKAEFWEDYHRLINQLNDFKLRNYHSIMIRNKWADPNSSYNSVERSLAIGASAKLRWEDPEYRARLSVSIKEAQKRRYFNLGDREICVSNAKNAWVTRRARYGDKGFSDRPRKQRFKTDRDRARLGERVRWGYTWRRLDQMFEMLFDDIVDEDAETLSCPYCNRVFSRMGWLRKHISTKHKSHELEEREIQDG